MSDVTDSAPKTGVEEVLKVSEFFLDYISECEGCYDAPLKASNRSTGQDDAELTGQLQIR